MVINAPSFLPSCRSDILGRRKATQGQEVGQQERGSQLMFVLVHVFSFLSAEKVFK